MNPPDLAPIIDAHDRLISTLGITMWVGMEPTFTRRFAESPEWLSEALGAEKLHYAHTLLREIVRLRPGGLILRTLGKQYAGETMPRWSLGYYQARSDQFLWDGPADPIIYDSSAVRSGAADRRSGESFWRILNEELNCGGWQSRAFTVEKGLRYRLLLRCDGNAPVIDIETKPGLARASVHTNKIPLQGLVDELAADGDLLLALDCPHAGDADHDRTGIVLELPAVPEVALFTHLVQCIRRAAKESGFETLILQGFPPPVDASVAWTTITPDPAVIEINQAPAENAADFYAWCDLSYRAADSAGLHPYRLHYNGVVADSGGGGQYTLGGPEPLGSPFLRYPNLLPRLVRYFNAHPSLSYWFAPASVGSSSQSPRTDEGVRESFRELDLALEQLEHHDQPDPEFVWRSLSPFMVDPSGNPHRSELNIEKLWNPYLPGRGCLGLVEFRAFRMSRSPYCAVSIAVLLRSIVAMLRREDWAPRLLDHGTKLHEKFALPFYMETDLQRVFWDLKQSGLPLHDSIQTILLHEPIRIIGKAEFQGCTVELQQALEFWPLIGDVASQESGGSRLVDASTTRLQAALRVESNHPIELDGWELWFNGYRIPLREEQDAHGPLKLIGLRYRNFLPFIGLHPGIAARGTISLVLVQRGRSEGLEITYHEWHPEGLPYPGLPADLMDAQKRRAERITTRIIPFETDRESKNLPESARTEYTLDLRRLPGL
jgi:uncharacterized protein (DUF2126 family)